MARRGFALFPNELRELIHPKQTCVLFSTSGGSHHADCEFRSGIYVACIYPTSDSLVNDPDVSFLVAPHPEFVHFQAFMSAVGGDEIRLLGDDVCTKWIKI